MDRQTRHKKYFVGNEDKTLPQPKDILLDIIRQVDRYYPTMLQVVMKTVAQDYKNMDIFHDESVDDFFAKLQSGLKN